jgi:hypothetical protein
VVERLLAKEKVAGSTPVSRSTEIRGLSPRGLTARPTVIQHVPLGNDLGTPPEYAAPVPRVARSAQE